MRTPLPNARLQHNRLRASPGERPRFLSQADCHDILQRIDRFTKGGGYTTVSIWSSWIGNVRWARNQVSTSGEVRNNYIMVDRNLNGASAGYLLINQTSDAALVAAARRAERLALSRPEHAQSDLVRRMPLEPLTTPQLFSDATYQLDSAHRSAAARRLLQSAVQSGMLSAGYIEVSAHSLAVLDTLGRVLYFPYTQAQYTVTVRDPNGVGSGWAGVDSYDWSKIDGEHLSSVALEKCLKSRNPVAIEPGRYTTILEPQAVGDFVSYLINPSQADPLSRDWAEWETQPNGWVSPFAKSRPQGNTPAFARFGERVIDERITISADPMDPELGFPPFNSWLWQMDQFDVPVYHGTTWIKDGVLANLAYDRNYGLHQLRTSTGLPDSGAFRMSGGETSIEEMISTTSRGILVTRFDRTMLLDGSSLLVRGNTRDGIWLIERGKISKAVKNLTFTESVLFALNNVEALGVPQRIFHVANPPYFMLEPAPVIAPALKVRDFSFTALDDAI